MDYVMELFKETDEMLERLYETSHMYYVWSIMRNWGFLKGVLVAEFYTNHIDYNTYTALSNKSDEYSKSIRKYLCERK